MSDRLEIGATPYGENCAQVGSDDYHERAKKECAAYRNQLIRMFGEPPDGARIVITSNPHDYGTYYEVAVRYDSNVPAAIKYAFLLEANTPKFWDSGACLELGI
jgi:hypothetical protein